MTEQSQSFAMSENDGRTPTATVDHEKREGEVTRGNESGRVIREAVKQIMAEGMLTPKEVLTTEEAARYMGVAVSYLYKLTSRKEIPHYKPTGKICYFNRRELEAWLQRNRISSNDEMADRANLIAMKGGRR